MQGDRGGLGGVDPSQLRGGGGGGGDGSYFPGGQQGIGGQSYGLDPRYPRVLQSPRGPTAYADPIAMYSQDQHPASPNLGARRHPHELMSGNGGVSSGGGSGAGGYYGGSGA
ncbi:unnamed protein product, partial [Laminaria digitata]